MKKFLGIIISLIMAQQTFASVAVSPTRIEINANKIKTNYITTAIDIKGDTKVPMRFKVYTGYFTINEKSEMVTLDNSSDQYDISKKIKFVPSEFTVMQGKSQKVRLNIAGLKQLPDGESRAVIYIEDVNAKEFNIDTGMQGIGAQLIVKSRIGIPVYVDKGKVKKEGDIEYLNVVKENDGFYTDVKILSKGNSKIRYGLKYQISDGKKLIDEYKVTGLTVGQNNYYISKDKIKTDLIKNPGEYTLRAILTYDDENGKRRNIKKETILNIKGEM